MCFLLDSRRKEGDMECGQGVRFRGLIPQKPEIGVMMGNDG